MPIKQVSTSLPLDYQSEQARIARAQQLAQSLQAQSLQPQEGRMIGDRYVGTTPLQGIAKLVQAFASSKALDNADKEQSGLNSRISDDRAKTLARAMQAREGTPAQATGDFEGGRPMGAGAQPEMTQAIPGNNKDFANILASSAFPDLQKYGIESLLKSPDTEKPYVVGRSLLDNKGKVLGIDSTWQEEQRANREAKEAELNLKLEDQRLSRQERADLQRELLKSQIEGRKETARLVSALRPEREKNEQIIQTDQGPMRLVNGQAVPITGVDGKPVQGKMLAEKPLTDAQSKAVLFGSRMESSNDVFDSLEKKGVTTSMPGANSGYGVGSVINALSPAGQQQLNQAKRDFVNATLRRESGAVISPSEFDNAEKQYFPQIGDSKEVKEQKKKNREVAIRGVQAEIPNASKGLINEVKGGKNGVVAPRDTTNINSLLDKYAPK